MGLYIEIILEKRQRDGAGRDSIRIVFDGRDIYNTSYLFTSLVFFTIVYY